jgi:hypothetical protein
VNPTFWDRWIWPAGGSGGIPGDIVATLIWVIIAAIATALLYPPVRRALRRFEERHLAAVKSHITEENKEIHKRLDHLHEKVDAVHQHLGIEQEDRGRSGKDDPRGPIPNDPR